VDFGERDLHWLRNVTEPIATYSARPRECPAEGVKTAVRAALARRGSAPTRTELAA
jgi:hypothetical protein